MHLHLLKSNRHIIFLYRKLKSKLVELKDTIEVYAKLHGNLRDNDESSHYSIRNWKQFSLKIRQKQKPLLLRLNDFPESVLVAGCQRSGTTMLSRIITQSEGMVNFWTERDEELEAALILSGVKTYYSRGRHCFQTTYVNECMGEYFDLLNGQMGHKLIWVLRNPYSVVYSMLYNWEDFALNELFRFCGIQAMRDQPQLAFRCSRNVSRLEKACLSYNAKTSQIFALQKELKKNRLMIINYEKLVKDRFNVFPLIFRFINLPYNASYLNHISETKLLKYKTLSARELELVKKICMPVYNQTQELIKIYN